MAANSVTKLQFCFSDYQFVKAYSKGMHELCKLIQLLPFFLLGMKFDFKSKNSLN